MIDAIYPLHNRLFYTHMTFPRFLHECIVTNSKLWVYDDNSEDGSSEFVQMCIERSGYKNVHYTRKEIGNSTYCINQTLKLGKAKFLYKCDCDIVIPEGSFDFMVQHIPLTCGFLMMRESGDFPKINSREVKERTHIGGVGLFRREAFEGKLIQTEGRFFGFTHFQNQSSWDKCEIDATNMNLDMCLWYSREKEYEKKGYGRALCKVKSVFQPDL